MVSLTNWGTGPGVRCDWRGGGCEGQEVEWWNALT